MSPKNHGKKWSDSDLAQLQKLVRQNAPTRIIGLKLGRSEEAVYSKASEEEISLKPTNQTPYNRQ
jgi:hypothetical protein